MQAALYGLSTQLQFRGHFIDGLLLHITQQQHLAIARWQGLDCRDQIDSQTHVDYEHGLLHGCIGE